MAGEKKTVKSTPKAPKKQAASAKAKQPTDWKAALPAKVGVRLPISADGKSVVQVVFSADTDLLDTEDFHGWTGTVAATYDFENGTVVAVEAPIYAFQRHLVAYDDSVEMGALKSLDGTVLWGYDAAEEANAEEPTVEASIEEHLGNGAFDDLCRRIVHALTAAASG